MVISAVGFINFKGKIIDSHAHLGKWAGIECKTEDLDTFTRQPLKNGDTVEKIIVSSADCLGINSAMDEINGNKKLLFNIYNKNKYIPLAVCRPDLTRGNTENIEALFKVFPNEFAGLKFHPREMQVQASSPLYDAYMKFAKKRNLPCLFHSDKTFDAHYDSGYVDPKCIYSNPDQIYKLAKRHKTVPVILAHMGGNSGVNTQKAIDVLVDSIEKNSATLYADISWVNPDTAEKPDIIEAIKRLKNTSKGDKTDRLLFGTDAPIGRFGGNGEFGLSPFDSYGKVVEDVKNEIKRNFSEDEANNLIDKIFYQNAYNLFIKKRNA